MSLPERNASISYHLTSQPGAGPRVSRGLRETPDLCLPFSQVFPGYCSLRWWHEAYVDGTRGRTYFTALRRTVPSSVCFWYFSWALLFSPRMQRFLESCSRFSVSFSAFPQIPGFASVRGSPPAPSWHSLDGNLAIWVVRGSPPVVSWHTLDGNPASSRQGPALRALARQEHLGSAVPLGLPFDLNYEVYASTSSVASGALSWIPRGTQGLFQDAWNKVFSVREEERSATR